MVVSVIMSGSGSLSYTTDRIKDILDPIPHFGESITLFVSQRHEELDREIEHK